MYNTLLSNLGSIICQMVAYGRLKTKENVKLLALKVVAGIYENLSLARSSTYSYLLYFLQLVTVAYEQAPGSV